MNIKIKNLSYSYKDKEVLKDINLEIKQGELISIVGHSGSGKTTLINLITGVIKNKLLDISKEERKQIAYSLQNPEHQLFGRTVKQEVYFLNPEDKVNELINRLNIKEDVMKQSPFSLSEGQKRQISLVGVLANDPKVIIMDEPSSNLDKKSLDELIKIIKDLNKEGKTLIIISHDLNFVNKLNGRLVILEEGQIKYDGNSNEGLSNLEKFTSKLIKEDDYV